MVDDHASSRLDFDQISARFAIARHLELCAHSHDALLFDRAGHTNRPIAHDPGARWEPQEFDVASGAWRNEVPRQARVAVIDLAELGGLLVDPQRALNVGDAAPARGREREADQAGQLVAAGHGLETMRAQEGRAHQRFGIGSPVGPAALRVRDHEPARFELVGRRALERHSLIADVPPNGVGPSSLAAGGRCQLALEMGDVVPVVGQSRGPCDCGERFADLFPYGAD